MTEPMFSCQLDGCRVEVSYPANMLALHKGEPICQGCYESGEIGITEDDPDWSDLPAFVPEAHKMLIRWMNVDPTDTEFLRAKTRAFIDRGA